MKASEARDMILSNLVTKSGADSACSENLEKCCNNVIVTRIICRRSAMFLLAISALFVLLLQPSGSLGYSSNGDIRVDVNVPKEAELGKSVSLECTWKLSGNNTLYSVKWYKDEYEFFSYNPDNDLQDRIKTHPRNGVTIDVRSSNKTFIRLTHLTLNSSGQYKCEVSTGAPFFATNYLEGNLTVIVLPNEKPVISGLASYYAVGENVTANCMSWPSVPKARLQWTINNKTVPTEYTVEPPSLHQPIKSQLLGIPNSQLKGIPNSLGLRLELNNRHSVGSGGMLRVRCLARVGSHLFETEERVQLVHANNQRFSAGDLRSRAAASVAVCSTFLISVALILST